MYSWCCEYYTREQVGGDVVVGAQPPSSLGLWVTGLVDPTGHQLYER